MMTAALRKDPTMKVLLALLFLLVFQYPALAANKPIEFGMTKQEAAANGLTDPEGSYWTHWGTHKVQVKYEFTNNRVSKRLMLFWGVDSKEVVDYFDKQFGISKEHIWYGHNQVIVMHGGTAPFFILESYSPTMQGTTDL